MLADRFKPRIVIASATIFWGAFQAIAAVATSWPVLLLTRLGLGASEAPIYPAGGKLNGIWMTQTERGRGATLLDGGAPLGAALGSIVIAWLIRRLQFLAHGFCHRRCRNHAVRAARLVLHPQFSATASVDTRPRRATSNRRMRWKTQARRRQAARAGRLIFASAQCGACAWAGCSSTPPSTAADVDADLSVQGS